MNMWVGSFVYLVVISLSILCIAISSALKLVCRPGSLFDICISCFYWVEDSVASFFFLPTSVINFLGGTKDPSE